VIRKDLMLIAETICEVVQKSSSEKWLLMSPKPFLDNIRVADEPPATVIDHWNVRLRL